MIMIIKIVFLTSSKWRHCRHELKKRRLQSGPRLNMAKAAQHFQQTNKTKVNK